MPTLESQILAAVGELRYKPLKLKALARKLNLPDAYSPFRIIVKDLLKQGRLALGTNSTIKLPPVPSILLEMSAYRQDGAPGRSAWRRE